MAVLSVDPSSPISGGSILGDKTRMERLSVEERAFIRPSPSRGHLGGVARRTRETILLCEAAGFENVLVETVGVGQSETAVRSMTDFFLLLMLAGAGDELQGIKRGIIEMIDGMAINKADGDNKRKAERARIEYSSALHLFPASADGWMPRVLTCSALDGRRRRRDLGHGARASREARSIRPPGGAAQPAGARMDARAGFDGSRRFVPRPRRGVGAAAAPGRSGGRAGRLRRSPPAAS